MNRHAHEHRQAEYIMAYDTMNRTVSTDREHVRHAEQRRRHDASGDGTPSPARGMGNA